MKDKKKIYLYATPLAFVFGIVFGTLFIAYVVVAQSYFNATNFLFQGGSIANTSGAPVALMLPQGSVGMGKTPDHINYRLDIVGDINADDSITTDEFVGQLARIQTADITTELNVPGEFNAEGVSNFTGGDYRFEISDPDGTVTLNLSSLFDVIPPPTGKQWWDGIAGNWEWGHVYDDDPTYGGRFDMTAAHLCEGETSDGSHNGPYYQVLPSSIDEDTWHRVVCDNNPTPPCCGLSVPAGCEHF